MSSVTLTLTEIAAVVVFAVTLAATDAAALSRLCIAALSKRAGVSPTDIYQYEQATSGDDAGESDGG